MPGQKMYGKGTKKNALQRSFQIEISEEDMTAIFTELAKYEQENN